MVPIALFLLSMSPGSQATGTSAIAAQDDVSNLIAGAGNPPSMKIADLPASYTAFRLRQSGGSDSDGMGGFGSLIMMSMMMSRPGGNGNQAMGQMLSANALNGIYFSEGKTIAFEGHSFLVAYRLSVGLSPDTLTTQAPSLGSNLKLELVRTDDLRSISPEPTITADFLKATLTKAQVKVDDEVVADSGTSQRTASTATSAAIMLPMMEQARMAAQKTVAISKAKQLSLRVLMYASDYDDRLPIANSTDEAAAATLPYLKNVDLWKSPNPRGARFLFNCHLSRLTLTALELPATTPMIYESAPWPDGTRVVAFADGHAKRVSQDEWMSAVQPMLNRRYR